MMPEPEPQAEEKLQAEGKRRTDRVFAPILIRVIGSDAGGVAFSEDTVTISFNQQGARISLQHSLLPDDVVLIMNKQNHVEEEFRVVGVLRQVVGDRAEWGVEVLNPESDIWGIEFTPPAEGVQPKALIECAACKKLAQSPMSSIEYDVLLATGMISRHCDRCRETTRWRPSQQTAMPEVVSAGAVKPSAEQRKARRLRLAMRVRVRNSWGVTDVAQTRDVSKAGVCFLSSKVFGVGEEIFVVLPFAANSVPVETKGKIIWSSLSSDSSARYYGVSYVK